MSADQAGKPHLKAVDGLRGIAIALVVVYHLWLVYGIDLGVVSRVGFLGVDLFFALSGFCIFFPYARAHFAGKEPPTLQSFAWRRAIKIVPSYVLALTAIAFLVASRGGTSGLAGAYLTHLFFLHPFVPDDFRSISGPLWTI